MAFTGYCPGDQYFRRIQPMPGYNTKAAYKTKAKWEGETACWEQLKRQHAKTHIPPCKFSVFSTNSFWRPVHRHQPTQHITRHIELSKLSGCCLCQPGCATILSGPCLGASEDKGKSSTHNPQHWKLVWVQGIQQCEHDRKNHRRWHIHRTIHAPCKTHSILAQAPADSDSDGFKQA